MFKIFLFLLIGGCFIATGLEAQITITRNGFVFLGGSYSLNRIFSKMQVTSGGNQQWSNPVTTGFAGKATLQYDSTTDFQNALLSSGFVSLSPAYGFYMISVFQIDETSVREIGAQVDEQHYGLSQLTGNTNDSLNFPKQTVKTSGFRYVIKFPATAGTASSSAYHFEVNGVLTVTAFGINKTPMSKSSAVTYTDTVIAWGKARIPTTGQGGLSDWIDVLCVKRKVVALDSLFLAGSPAPPALLAGLGATQGMVTKTYRYIFWRPNLVPLINVSYGADSTYGTSTRAPIGSDNYAPDSPADTTTPATILFDGSVLSVSGVDQGQAAASSPAAYPNPANGQITISFNKPSDGLCTIEFVNGRGAVAQTTPVFSPAGVVQVPISVRDLPNGAYRYAVRNERGDVIASGSVDVVK